MFTGSAMAQAAAPAPAAAAVKPEAIPAKIALIAFEQAVVATNEGSKAVSDLQAKYLPKKNQIDALSKEVDLLKKQLDAAPATLPDAERTERLRVIDTKEKQLNLDGSDATAAYNAELQDIYGKIATKVSATTKAYCEQNGYTILLDVSGQQSNVMWAQQNTDITQAVVDTYNASSGAAPPAAPSATRKSSTSTAPRTTPKPATK